MDPHKWALLPESTQQAILLHYKCHPPTTSIVMETTSTSMAPTTSSNTETIDHIIDMTNPLEFHRCYGGSNDDQTRLSLPHLEGDLQNLHRLRKDLAEAPRDQAPNILREALLRSEDLPLIYWKKMDRTHYRDSPPDGACGWHTIAQAIHRMNTNSLLDLYSTPGQQRAADILSTLQEQSPP